MANFKTMEQHHRWVGIMDPNPTKGKTGETKNRRNEVTNMVEKFYSNLYTSVNPKQDKFPNVTNVGSVQIPDILFEEL